MRSISIATLLCFIILSISTGWAEAHAAGRPNIIVILADDMGFSDIGCYGSEISTPTLDGLAANGIRMTQFYNTARCCPTRASILTGLYPHQAGVGWMMSDLGHPGYRGNLNRRCVTMAEVLKAAGYSTYMAGKWHITPKVQPDGPKDNWPRQRGFDRFYGTIHGAGSFFDPNSLTRDNKQISPYADPQYKPDQYYYTDAISDHAVRYINEHVESSQTGNQPFFIYVAYTAAHWPMHALPQDIAKYKGKYDGGYGPVRAARFKKAQDLGLIDPSWKLTPQADDWEKNKHKAWDARNMEVYAAMVDSMDQGIGRIVDALKKSGQFDNTLVMYMQDNGGCAEGLGRGVRGPNGGKRADKPTLEPMAADALQTGMIPRQSRDGYPMLMGPNVMAGPADTYIAYGRGWANVSNTPFREYKHWVHEGGIATPLVAHWPKGIPASQNGKLVSEPGHLIDIMATCVDISGATYPKTFHDGQKITPMEGKSLLPAFRGGEIDRDALYWEHEGNVAIRVGKWKAVAKFAGYKSDRWELYDMTADRTETENLAEQMPQKLKELKARWEAFAEKADFLPVYGGKGQAKPRSKPANRKKKKFSLKAGADLPAEAAPFVEGLAFALTARIEAPGRSGVIVAQGGVMDGYALYLDEGRLVFATRHQGKLSTVSSAQAIGNPVGKVSVKLDQAGQVTLSADGKTVAAGQVPGPMARMPIDGLQVGSDTGGAVGQYAAPHPFAGRIGGIEMKLGG